MKTGDTIIRNRQVAQEYDAQARRTNWHGNDVVFGMMAEYIHHGERLLDLGIGSGLSSILFHQAGLKIYGLDGSKEVLEVCRNKNFAKELQIHDLREFPYPYSDQQFDHVVSVAVLNSFNNLDGIFNEIARIIKPGGMFTFTLEDRMEGEAESYAINRVNVDEAANEEEAVLLYRHCEEDVRSTLALAGFLVEKTLKFAAFHYPAEKRDVFFRVYVARRV
jgi:predicted TPR repeat methyltransferase